MPDRAKVRWSQLKVGVIALAAFIILFVLIFLLTSSKGFFKHYEPLCTYMDDASGMADGTAGAAERHSRSATWTTIELTEFARSEARRSKFDMQVKAKFLKQIPVDSIAAISAANLLGDKFLNITKRTGSADGDGRARSFRACRRRTFRS